MVKFGRVYSAMYETDRQTDRQTDTLIAILRARVDIIGFGLWPTRPARQRQRQTVARIDE